MKLLISSHLTRLRVLMALRDHDGLDRAALELEACIRRYDPFAIDRTTATRMTRNIMRCLAIAAVMAWHRNDRLRFDGVILEVQRLQRASHADRFDPIAQRTQEDHRLFADQMLLLLQSCQWSADASGARPAPDRFVEPVLLVYFPVMRPDRAEKAWRFLDGLSQPSHG